MENKKLNNLVLKFKRERDDESFNEIYEAVIGSLRYKKAKIAQSIGSTPEDVQALYEDKLLVYIEKYEEGSGNFLNYFNSAIVGHRRNLLRKSKTRSKHEFHYEQYSKSEEDPEAATFELPNDYDLENEVLQTKKADQRQLIDFLLKDSDATTTAIVEAYLTLPKPNPLAIEKATGICRKKVSRRLEKLASKFDSQTFGNYTDYLVAL